MADMINHGMALDSSTAWDAWPQDLPLLLYHGDEDSVCDIKAATRFAENCRAKDKRMEPIKVRPPEDLSGSSLPIISHC